MRARAAIGVGAVVVAIMFFPVVSAQAPANAGAPTYFVPVGPPANARPSQPADLSGDWSHPVAQSLSLADPGGNRRGKEGDVPYQPWALEKMMNERPPGGPSSDYANNTDPHLQYCEPLGLTRTYSYPSKVKFIQTPEAVYILHEIGPTFRVVWLNGKHPDDPDPQYWGHSIGWYENGDTLVVDTIGVNDRSWLDSPAHPHSDQLHLIERYRRINPTTIQLDITIDDPGAYTRAWAGRRTFTKSETGFLRYQWVCSVREQEHHQNLLGQPASTPPGGQK
jgi:hypothetical protein